MHTTMPFTRLLVCCLLLVAASMIISSGAIAAGSGPQPLPSGYLSTRGSQIVDSHGHPVRIACCDDFGAGTDDGYISYDYADYGPYRTLDANLAAITKCGFNCLRVDFNDRIVNDAPMMADYDSLVAACKQYGLKVILCHHNDEATPHDWGNVAQQTNGLWIDSGPGTDGSDDSKGHPAGTVTAEKFKQDWVKIAKRYAGNDTVIGFDLDNEPHNNWGKNNNTLNWGEGGPDDIWAMFTNTGNAIQSVDPGALIICEGAMMVTDNTSLLYWVQDLAQVRTKPVVLHIPHKVVYSSHEYPSEVGGSDPNHDHGDYYIKVLNANWGYLIKENIAPVWIGESGASMISQNSLAWGKTLVDYMNGLAPGGPRFTKDQQPVSGNWFWWRCVPDENPDGCLMADGQLNPLQKPFIEQLFFYPMGHKFTQLDTK